MVLDAYFGVKVLFPLNQFFIYMVQKFNLSIFFVLYHWNKW